MLNAETVPDVRALSVAMPERAGSGVRLAAAPVGNDVVASNVVLAGPPTNVTDVKLAPENACCPTLVVRAGMLSAPVNGLLLKAELLMVVRLALSVRVPVSLPAEVRLNALCPIVVRLARFERLRSGPVRLCPANALLPRMDSPLGNTLLSPGVSPGVVITVNGLLLKAKPPMVARLALSVRVPVSLLAEVR